MKRKHKIKLGLFLFVMLISVKVSLVIYKKLVCRFANKDTKDYKILLDYKDINNEFGLVGRWFKKDIKGIPHFVTVNDGSQIFFKVTGTKSIYVNFTVITKMKTPYFAYSIDGDKPVRQLISNPVIKFKDNNEHIIRIIIDGMTESEKKWNNEIGVALRNIDYGYGKISGILPTNKLIAFYGDSITEGIRALNINADSDGNSATHSYVWYCCRNLKTVPYFIGFGA